MIALAPDLEPGSRLGTSRLRLYLGLDVGTSVVKACAFDEAGVAVATARASVPVDRPRSTWAQQDPQAVWRAAARCIRRVAHAAEGHEWRAIGIAAQGDGCWLVDEQLRPVGPAPLWLDGRAAPVVAEWSANGVDHAYFEHTANVPFPGAVPALLRWYELHERSTLDGAHWLLSCADWIVACLADVAGTDPVNASRGVTDTTQAGWSPALASALGIGDWSHLLPPVSPTIGARGSLTARAALETGLPIGLPVMSATLDASATMIGSGAFEPGDALTILGTTVFNSVVGTAPVRSPLGVGFNAPAAAGGWARTMATMAGTSNLDWVARTLRIRSSPRRNRLSELAAGAPAGSNGVLYLPFISPGGERAPFVAPTAKAGFVGLDTADDAATLVRAAFEGVALSVRHCYAFLPPSHDPIGITGGGARSRLWCQIVSDVIRRPVQRVDVDEPGALGVALAAAVACGDMTTLAEGIALWVHRGERFDPTAAADLYDDLYGLYLSAIGAHLPLWEARSKLDLSAGAHG